jgi:hypothetical protein
MLARLYCRSSAALQGMLAPSACGRERPGLLQRRACAFCGTFCARVASCFWRALLYCTLVFILYSRILQVHFWRALLYCTLVFILYSRILQVHSRAPR